MTAAFKYNMDQKTRDEIIFGDKPLEYAGGCEHFDKLPAEKLVKLISAKFADPEESHNSCPTIGVIVQFMRDNTDSEKYEIIAGGYTVESRRDDYRVSVDAVEIAPRKGKKIPVAVVKAFRERFVNADEFTANQYGCFVWYD